MNTPHRDAEHRKGEWRQGAFLPIASQDYSDIHQFFVREALLLDHHRYDEWCTAFSRDVRYTVRQSGLTASRESLGPQEITFDYLAMVERIAQLPSGTDAKAETANVALRRFVANLSVCFADCRAEYDVVSYILVSQYAKDTGTTTFLTAERRDRLRRRDRSFAIARREILYDQKSNDPLVAMILL